MLDLLFSWSDGLLLGAEYSTPTTKTTTLENEREKDSRRERDIGRERERQTKKDRKREKDKFLKEQDTQRAPI